MSLALELASEFGVGVVGANNTYFTGLLGYYCEMAAARGLVSIVASSNEALVAQAVGRPGWGRIRSRSDSPTAANRSSGTSARRRLPAARCGCAPGGTSRSPPAWRLIPTAFRPQTPTLRWPAALSWGGHRGSGLSIMIQLLGLMAGAPDVGSREVGCHSAMLLIAVDPAGSAARMTWPGGPLASPRTCDRRPASVMAPSACRSSALACSASRPWRQA